MLPHRAEFKLVVLHKHHQFIIIIINIIITFVNIIVINIIITFVNIIIIIIIIIININIIQWCSGMSLTPSTDFH